MTARWEAPLLFHLPATGTGKAGDFAAFFFTNSTVELKAVLFQKGAALFWIGRGKGDVLHVASTVSKFVEASLQPLILDENTVVSIETY